MIAVEDLAMTTRDYLGIGFVLVVVSILAVLWVRDDRRREAMAKERWEAIQTPTGWTVERNGRLVAYDVQTQRAVRKLVERKGGNLSTLRFIDSRGNIIDPSEVEEGV